MAQNFTPIAKGRKDITVSAVSQRIQLATAKNGDWDVRMINKGTAEVAFCYGDSMVVASFTLDPTLQPAPWCEVLRGVATTTDGLYVAVIAAGATGTVEFCIGSGS